MLTAAPDWREVARGLLCAISIARDASKRWRAREKLPGDGVERLRLCELEIGLYRRKAQQFIDRADEIDQAEWRQVILDLFRAHSLVWETHWVRYEGLPNVETGSGLGEAGAEITRYVLAAVEALAATNPAFGHVDWNGREMTR